MILRDAARSDEPALQDFDLGPQPTIWLSEISEILSGLIAWRDDETRADLDRRVVVADIRGEVVAVAAHELGEDHQQGPLPAERYLMVVAVRHDHHRDGIASTVAESVIADMQRNDVRYVHWLVYPTNLASIAFSRSVFPEANESYPPQDRPYARFVLLL